MFDESKYKKAALVPRTEDVNVPELAPFFKGKNTVWKVRGLTGLELHRVKDSAESRDIINAAINAFCGTKSEQAEAFKTAFALDDKTPEEYSKYIEIISIGSVEPAVSRETVVKMAAEFYATVKTLAEKILQLSALGHEPGKPKGSGKTGESERA